MFFPTTTNIPTTNKIVLHRPPPGDHLIRYDGFRFGLPEQHAICVTEADFFSPAMVVHFDFKRGVVADDLGSFARTPPDPKIGRRGLPVLSDEAAPVYVVPHGTSERLAAVRTKNRAIRMLGKTGCHQVLGARGGGSAEQVGGVGVMFREKNFLHQIYNNCEHFASWAVLGERKCKQLWIVGGLAFAASGALHAGGYVIGGAWGFATAHGIFILCKWGCILYFGSDATEHYWESIQVGTPRNMTTTQYDRAGRSRDETTTTSLGRRFLYQIVSTWCELRPWFARHRQEKMN